MFGISSLAHLPFHTTRTDMIPSGPVPTTAEPKGGIRGNISASASEGKKAAMLQRQQSGGAIEKTPPGARRVQLVPHPVNEKLDALLKDLWADHLNMQNQSMSPEEALTLYQAQQAYLELSPKARKRKNIDGTTESEKLSPEARLVKAWDDIAGKGKFPDARSKTVSYYRSGAVYASSPQLANLTQLIAGFYLLIATANQEYADKNRIQIATTYLILTVTAAMVAVVENTYALQFALAWQDGIRNGQSDRPAELKGAHAPGYPQLVAALEENRDAMGSDYVEIRREIMELRNAIQSNDERAPELAIALEKRIGAASSKVQTHSGLTQKVDRRRDVIDIAKHGQTWQTDSRILGVLSLAAAVLVGIFTGNRFKFATAQVVARGSSALLTLPAGSRDDYLKQYATNLAAAKAVHFTTQEFDAEVAAGTKTWRDATPADMNPKRLAKKDFYRSTKSYLLSQQFTTILEFGVMSALNKTVGKRKKYLLTTDSGISARDAVQRRNLIEKGCPRARERRELEVKWNQLRVLDEKDLTRLEELDAQKDGEYTEALANHDALDGYERDLLQSLEERRTALSAKEKGELEGLVSNVDGLQFQLKLFKEGNVVQLSPQNKEFLVKVLRNNVADLRSTAWMWTKMAWHNPVWVLTEFGQRFGTIFPIIFFGAFGQLLASAIFGEVNAFRYLKGEGPLPKAATIPIAGSLTVGSLIVQAMIYLLINFKISTRTQLIALQKDNPALARKLKEFMDAVDALTPAEKKAWDKSQAGWRKWKALSLFLEKGDLSPELQEKLKEIGDLALTPAEKRELALKPKLQNVGDYQLVRNFGLAMNLAWKGTYQVPALVLEHMKVHGARVPKVGIPFTEFAVGGWTIKKGAMQKSDEMAGQLSVSIAEARSLLSSAPIARLPVMDVRGSSDDDQTGGKRPPRTEPEAKAPEEGSNTRDDGRKIEPKMSGALPPKVTAQKSEDAEGEPVAKTVDEPAAKTADEPAAKTVDEPVAKPADEPVAKTVDEPAAKTVDEPVAKPADEPAAKTVDEPAAKTADEPVAKTADEPVAKTVDEPVKDVASLVGETSSRPPEVLSRTEDRAVNSDTINYDELTRQKTQLSEELRALRGEIDLLTEYEREIEKVSGLTREVRDELRSSGIRRETPAVVPLVSAPPHLAEAGQRSWTSGRAIVRTITSSPPAASARASAAGRSSEGSREEGKKSSRFKSITRLLKPLRSNSERTDITTETPGRDASAGSTSGSSRRFARLGRILGRRKNEGVKPVKAESAAPVAASRFQGLEELRFDEFSTEFEI